MDICPACGLRAIEDERSGFCMPCAEDRAADRYLERDTEEMAERRQDWAERTGKARTASTGARAARERQRRHRLREVMRPQEPPSVWLDPLELGKEALDLLHLVRQSLGAQSVARGYLDSACELVRQLSWGPDGETVLEDKPGPNAFTRRRLVIVRPRLIRPVEGQIPLLEEEAS